VAFLIVVLRLVVERVDARATGLGYNVTALEVRRDSECAARTALAVRAVADNMKPGFSGQRDRDGATGALSGSVH